MSAIDLGRVWERALRKAELPIAYSEGFSPHPKVSFPDALPLGYASTGEYVEMTFAVPVTPDALRKGLNAAFPDGIEVLAAVEVAAGAPRLSKWLVASVWELHYPDARPDALRGAAEAVLASDSAVVQRRRKDEVAAVDVRPAIGALAADAHTVRALVRHVEPPVRPSELHAALAACEAFTEAPLDEPALAVRVAQGTPIADGLTEALTGEPVTITPTSREDDGNRD